MIKLKENKNTVDDSMSGMYSLISLFLFVIYTFGELGKEHFSVPTSRQYSLKLDSTMISRKEEVYWNQCCKMYSWKYRSLESARP